MKKTNELLKVVEGEVIYSWNNGTYTGLHRFGMDIENSFPIYKTEFEKHELLSYGIKAEGVRNNIYIYYLTPEIKFGVLNADVKGRGFAEKLFNLAVKIADNETWKINSRCYVPFDEYSDAKCRWFDSSLYYVQNEYVPDNVEEDGDDTNFASPRLQIKFDQNTLFTFPTTLAKCQYNGAVTLTKILEENMVFTMEVIKYEKSQKMALSFKVVKYENDDDEFGTILWQSENFYSLASEKIISNSFLNLGSEEDIKIIVSNYEQISDHAFVEVVSCGDESNVNSGFITKARRLILNNQTGYLRDMFNIPIQVDTI